jgi:hypothetical protein
LTTIWSYATTGRWNYRTGESEPSRLVLRTIQSCPTEFAAAIERTFASQDMSFTWGRPDGVLVRRALVFEDRLLFIFGLPQEFRPGNTWIASQIERGLQHWRERRGDKSSAVKVIKALDSSGLNMDLISQSSAVLADWLREDLERMEDWAPLLDYAVLVALDDRDEIIDEFSSFMGSELRRWSPTPPDFDLLVEYAERFGIDAEHQEDLDAAKEREAEAESDANSGSARYFSQAGLSRPSSDEAIDLLFASLRNRAAP